MTATQTFLVFCEGPTDHRVIATLTRRTLGELAEWVDPAFRGLEPDEPFFTWSKLKDRRDVPRSLGHRGDDWGGDSECAWRALHLAERVDDLTGVILLRDSDSESVEEKRRALLAAVKKVQSDRKRPVAFGVACTKLEAWQLAALPDAENRAELRQELGFDPVTRAQKLTAADELAKRSAKRVLRAMASGAEADEALEKIDLETLVENGKDTGLPQFLCQVRCNLGREVVGHVPRVDWCACDEA